MLGRQAKILSDMQIKAVLGALDGSRNGLRNKVMFLLSLNGLRAKEVAALELSMITDAEGNLADSIALQDKATKGHSGRVVFMSPALKEALIEYLDQRRSISSKYVIVTERSERFSAHAVVVFFARLYRKLGFVGLSSHSGRRSFATRAARKMSQAGGSLRDVQALLGHRWISTTEKYLDQEMDAQRKVTTMIYV
jgi:integrase/recombinase XerD